ncbi:ATP-grasp domain-containing protein [Bacillus rubiinfantis]|uniref:ATP-grasp domain-containing protein n=1 Tax=Bacillus rubiinfantis TaxID=1499680 RepID=UPI0005A653C1|nr:ATP-grasp domain-containing protein [Bacillus rubiinfantis]
MNILLCSAGRRVKLVQYFQEGLRKIGGKVIAADCDPTAPALHFADIKETVPRITHPDYIASIKQLCKKHQVQAILSLIDPELSLLAQFKEDFAKEQINVIVSSAEVIDICFDKYLTHTFLRKHDIPTVATYLHLQDIITRLEHNELQFPLIVKPRKGSASIGISFVHSLEELLALWKADGEVIAQPLMEGDEYGVDCYVDLIHHQPVNIFCKRKIRMRAGETDKSVAVFDDTLFQLIEKLVKVLEPIGPIDIDCFKTNEGYVISEINPRFGGGYPHAHEAGQNFISKLINNLRGMANQSEIGNYPDGSVMIKFDNVMMLNASSIEKVLK